MACLHTADWWRRHWQRSQIAHVEMAGTLPDGWKHWLAWQQAVAPDTLWKSTPSPLTRALSRLRPRHRPAPSRHHT